MCRGRVNVTKVTQKFIKTFQAVWFAFSWISFIFPLLELTSAVGADKTLGVELVTHGSAHSSFCNKVELMTLIIIGVPN